MLFNKIKKKVYLEKKSKTKIGLALGGGGARGFAHIGAIKAFEEYGLKFDYVCGTSAGSLVGAFYAAGYTYEEIYEVSRGLKEKDIRPSKIPIIPSRTDGIEDVIIKNIGDIDIKDLKIPFSAVAVDIKTTNECIITKGRLAKAVAGSCCVPLVFQPVVFDDLLLCDGGLQNTMPANVPKLFGCDYVIAIDVNSARSYGTDSSRIIDVISCTVRILMKGNVSKGYLFADCVIQPETKRFKSTKMEGYEEMIDEGYKATLAKMPEILEIFNKKPLKKKVKQKFKDEAVII